MKNSRILLSFLCGITAGAIAAALYTPHKGSVTRKKLSKKGSAVVAGISNNMEKVGDQIKKTFGGEAEKAGGAVRKGKRKLS
jgi:gas vesicle protein